ncbi:hypothetical protein EBU95_16460 [bacterium]|uniref:Uncharacterized protein n=1 Tax=viral metagenome TaxID=1070528 RepID=A0A6C0EB93_9ZZZZ|nr:hypothetical protein [bacterium]
MNTYKLIEKYSRKNVNLYFSIYKSALYATFDNNMFFVNILSLKIPAEDMCGFYRDANYIEVSSFDNNFLLLYCFVNNRLHEIKLYKIHVCDIMEIERKEQTIMSDVIENLSSMEL